MKQNNQTMKLSSPLQSYKLHTTKKDTIWICFLNLGVLPLVLFLPLFLTTIISLFFFYTPSPLIKANSINHLINQTIPIAKPQKDVRDGTRNCDVYKGHWVLDRRGAAYTNATCATIPDSNNCFKYGRKDKGFLKWRWKPDGCELQRFDGKTFLEMVKGKTMAFVGDSVARNHVESLLCLLSKDETPTDVYKDPEDDRSQTWRFPDHNFTLKILWSRYLVEAEELGINGSASGSFRLNLNRADEKWAAEISRIDYAIISSAHWFFRRIYVYNGKKLLGCVYCNEHNVMSIRPEQALRLAMRSTFDHINKCGGCGGTVTLLRTFSPPHFENGTWDSGGTCPRTRPYRETEISMGSDEWLFRNAQVEEVERARKKGRGRRFGVLDVTRAMMMRPDGHPGEYWDNEWSKGNNIKDCVHWCMPGPIDVWSEFLMDELRRLGM